MEGRIPAGFGKRFWAFLIDSALLNIMLVSVGVVLGIALGITAVIISEMHQLTEEQVELFIVGSALLISTFGVYGYYAVAESSPLRGTLGKYVLKIEVITKNGQKIGFWRAAWRALAMILSFLPLGIGWLMILWTKDKQALHDILSGCYVVNKKNE